MKLSQLIESFVISNDEFEDYLDRATEQLAQEVQSGKNARDAVHDLALQFAKQHNSSYDAYTRMSDSLFARLHTLELEGSESTDLVPMDEPMADMGAMNEPELGGDMGAGDAMGGMDMDVPAEDEMPSDSDMEDYAAVMDNEPEAEEMEESCGSSHKKKMKEEDTTMGSITVKSDEERAGRAALANLRKIVDEKQARSIKFVDGSTKVDMFTASAIVKVYDAVNATNKAKIINMLGTGKAGLLKVANAAMKLVSTNESLQENPLAAIAPVAGAIARGVATLAKNPIARGAAVGAAKGAVKGGMTAMASGKNYATRNSHPSESVEDIASKVMESSIYKASNTKK